MKEELHRAPGPGRRRRRRNEQTEEGRAWHCAGSPPRSRFVVVAFLGIGVFGDFSGERRSRLVGARPPPIALAVAFVVYAVVEYLQTGALASITRQFDTRTIVLIPLAIAINIILGAAVANALKIPIYLDSIGTILVGALAGPIPGALTGFLANILWQYVIPPPFQGDGGCPVRHRGGGDRPAGGPLRPLRLPAPAAGPTAGQLAVGAAVAHGDRGRAWRSIAYSVGSIPATFDSVNADSDDAVFVLLGWLIALGPGRRAVVGLLALLFVRRDLTVAYVVGGRACSPAIVAALISAPISANLFSGVTGSGTDFLVAAFRQAGADIQAATFQPGPALRPGRQAHRPSSSSTWS